MTAVVTGVAVALATTFSQGAVAPGQPAPPKGAPVIVEHVAAAPPAGDTFAFPNPLDISRAQLAAFDSSGSEYMPGWVGTNQDYPWAWKHGGAAVGGVIIKLDLTGNRTTAVRIEGMQLDEQCHSPAIGTLFYSPPAGSSAVVRMGFNLDQAHPVAESLNGQSTGGVLSSQSVTFGGPYFQQNTITLSYNEPLQIQLLAATQKHYCEFRIDMSVLDGNRIVHELIGNAGQPFRVTAAIMAPASFDPRLKEINFAAYRRLYVGGVASSCHGWAAANPIVYSKTENNVGEC